MFESAPVPKNEPYRQQVLNRLGLLDSGPDPELDNLTELAARFFQTSYGLVSLVDRDRQWFKSKFGLDAPETPRGPSFCGHAICGDDVFLVPDAFQDRRFAGNPLVVGPPHVRFYAGAPLNFRRANIGTLCVIDVEPRHDFDAGAARRLRQFAQIAEELIEARAKRLGLRIDEPAPWGGGDVECARSDL